MPMLGPGMMPYQAYYPYPYDPRYGYMYGSIGTDSE
jgi:hypothetical protein